MRKVLHRIISSTIFAAIILSCGLALPASVSAAAASISLSPSTGTLVVDSTFDLQVLLDTGGQSVNAVDLTIAFPPDKLQVVSSSTGKSIIGIWPTQPKFNNQTGQINLTGGIPNGVNVRAGLITTLTFRAKSIGSAVVKIDHSKVLSNDGSGTEIAITTNNSLFQIVLPPPAGPVVVSDTHPNQTLWYKDNSVSLSWGDEGGVEGFSYMMSDNPVDVPDDISEGTQRNVVYSNVADGRHYFHIKGLRNGQWGGTTNYAVNIDKTPPAKFTLDIIPSARTTRPQPIIQFSSTDAISGMDHYELKLVPLQPDPTDTNLGQDLFIEATSPFIPATPLHLGDYDIIVRAYDQAGNYTEVTKRLSIVSVVLQNLGPDGLQFRGNSTIPWWAIWTGLGLLILLGVLAGYLIRRRHGHVHRQLQESGIPDHLQDQLAELERYRQKYGGAMVLIFALAVSMLFGRAVHAESTAPVLTPPLITTINKNLTNDEVFYAGGFTGVPDAEVVLFLQNLQTGETQQIDVTSDSAGQWFYRHNAFLSPGDYELWGQTKVGGQSSPPGSQIRLTVEKKALQFGASRISRETLYLFFILLLILILLLIVGYIVYHYRKIKHKNQLLASQVADIENSIRRGFAVLNRDIQAELASLRQNKKQTMEHEAYEQQLLTDLNNIEQYLSKEVWDLEKQNQ